MSKQQQPPQKPTPAPVKPERELPVVQFFGMAKARNGWVALAIKVQGDRILDREVLNPEQAAVPRHHAEAYFKRAVAQRLLIQPSEALE